jgi:hypothetical protein
MEGEEWEGTVDDLREQLGSTMNEAYALVNLLRRVGRAKRIGRQLSSTGWRRTKWRLPATIQLRLKIAD